MYIFLINSFSFLKEEIRKAITDRIQADFYKLREDSLQAHLAHLDAGKKKTD